ncbi:hypothetical protein TNCV_4814411 [Trichonephila clavipes]|nr:hypothetical protein TNCV_4814411 [Trichonephila clavipes]
MSEFNTAPLSGMPDDFRTLVVMQPFNKMFSPPLVCCCFRSFPLLLCTIVRYYGTAAVAKWYRYRTRACLVTSSSPVPLKTHRVGQRCMLNLSRAETSSR